MIDDIVKEQIELYLEYSSTKGLSVDDYIKIRKQAVEEYSLHKDKPAEQSTPKVRPAAIEQPVISAPQAETTSRKSVTKPSKITHIEEAGKSKQADFLQILKSVEE